MVNTRYAQGSVREVARGDVVLVHVLPNIPLSATVESVLPDGRRLVRVHEFNCSRLIDASAIVPPCDVTDDSCWDGENCRHCKLPRQADHQPGCPHWDFERALAWVDAYADKGEPE